MDSEIKKILQRVSALEINVTRLTQLAAGHNSVYAQVSQASVSCGQCDETLPVKHCSEPDCCQGLEPKPKRAPKKTAAKKKPAKKS